MKKNFLNNKIVEKYKIWFLLPAIILFISMIVYLSFGITSAVNNKNVVAGINDGFNIGIDFEGGTLMTLTLGEDEIAGKKYDEVVNKVKKAIESKGVKVTYTQASGDDSIIFKYDNTTEENNKAIRTAVDDLFKDQQLYDEGKLSYTSISPTASSDLILTAFISIIVSTILILIYVIIRFEFWSAISAVLALCHDVLMMVCLTVIFRVQINSSFIAAIITIVSYSINATIVLFDRVRENYKLNKPGSDIKEYNRMICNKSIKETFTRNINTTVTTLVAITVLAIIGGPSIREFALPVIFGLIVGCYSSMVISPSIFVLLKNKFGKNIVKTKKVKKAKEIA